VTEIPSIEDALRESRAQELKKRAGPVIPRFFGKNVQATGEPPLIAKLRKLSKDAVIERMISERATNEDLVDLHQDIKSMFGPEEKGVDSGWLDYDDFCKARKVAAPSLREALSLRLFLALPKSQSGFIKVDAVLCYLCRFLENQQGYLSLRKVVEMTGGMGGSAAISIESLTLWLRAQASQMTEIKQSYAVLESVYSQTSARKFAFFLDPNRTGRIGLTHLISSSHFAHFQHVQEREKLSARDRAQAPAQPNADPVRWFEPKTALKLYRVFAQLDVRKKARLRKEDFAKWNSGSLTTRFVDQLWQVIDMPKHDKKQSKEMSFDAYLDFALAMSHRFTPEGIRYLFGILDSESLGFLGRFHVQRFIDRSWTHLCVRSLS